MPAAIPYPFTGQSPNLEAPIGDGVSVTPNDTDEMTYVSRCLYIGVSGNVKVVTVNNATLTFKNVPVGFFPVRVRQVFETGTTASEILSLW